MPGDPLDLEHLIDVANDPRFIVGIFNYCNRRCDRCSFADRCRLHADQQLDEVLHPDRHWTVRVRQSIEKALALLKMWCAREGIDPEALQKDASSVDDEMRLIAAARRDPLMKMAERYAFTAMKLADALERSADLEAWPPEAREALKTIQWYGLLVSSKIHRALTGLIESRRDDLEDDPRQSDWNGSAKIARLGIAESRAAWETIVRIGRAPHDSPLMLLIAQLDGIDAAVAARFPDAMAFVRPGFDEP